jgi:uncharacterized membrane protein
MRLEVRQLVRVPREKVFAAYADLESIPRWSAAMESVRVISREGPVVRFELRPRTGGGGRTVVGEMTLDPPRAASVESETKGSRTRGTVRFEPVQGGTMVTSTLEVEVKGVRRFFVRPALGEEAEKAAERNMASFARYVEALEAPAGAHDAGNLREGPSAQHPARSAAKDDGQHP